MAAMATEEDAEVGRRLRALRERAGKSQAEVSAALTSMGATGFYPQTIAKLESGTRSLRFHEAAKLAEALGSSLGEMLTLTPLDGKRAAMRVAERDVRRQFDKAVAAAFELEVSMDYLRQAVDDLTGDVDGPQLTNARNTLLNCTSRHAAIAASNAFVDPAKRAEMIARMRHNA